MGAAVHPADGRRRTAVWEANGRGQFRRHAKYITTSPLWVDVQNLVGIDSAVTDLCMRENTLFGEFFNEHIYLSVRFFVAATGHSFGGHINIVPQ